MARFKHISSDSDKFQSARMIPGHKYQTPDGKHVYDSVTTILNNTKDQKVTQQLEEWRQSLGNAVADYILHESAIVGTQAHKLNEDYLYGVTSDDHTDETRLLARAHHENFKPYLDKIDNIHGIEMILHSDTLQIAGTSDCIAEYNGVLSIIDYKTKRSPQRFEWISDYFLQAAAYSIMYEELTGIRINRAVILVSSERDTIQAFVSDITDYTRDEFLARLAIYQYPDKINLPNTTTDAKIKNYTSVISKYPSELFVNRTWVHLCTMDHNPSYLAYAPMTRTLFHILLHAKVSAL